MKTKQVVVELLPGRIDVVVYDGGRRTGFNRLPITPQSDAGEWAKTVRRSGASLRSVVEQMGVGGCPATVLYRSPTQAVDLADFAVRSAGQAVEAATLSCADSLPYSALSAVCEGAIIGRDAGGPTRQMHVVVAAEREDIAEAIVQMTEEAGLKLLSSTPLDAAVMAGFIGAALREKSARQGRLYIGEHASFFVITNAGSLLFSRRIDLGVASLAHSLTRPIWVPGHDESIELDAATARDILHRHGIPDRDVIVHEPLALPGAKLIPLLQPVLQRFVVELRQSLRFGLNEEDRTDLAIHVTGPGSAIPGLVEMIGEELGVAASSDAAGGDGQASPSGFTADELADALGDQGLLRRLNLLPREVAWRRRIARLRRWLWTGAAAALVVIGVDGLRYHARVADVRVEAEALASRIDDLEALQATGQKLRSALETMNELEGTIAEEVGAAVDHRACLQELTRITPDTIRFTALAFHRLSGQTMGTVTGYAFQRGSATARTDLEAFVQRLRESPLFEDVVLGNVAVGSIGSLKGQRFEATFAAVAIPTEKEAKEQIAAAEGGSTR